MVHSFVDLAVQNCNGGSVDEEDRFHRILIALLENTKQINIASLGDLERLEKSSTDFRLLLRAFLLPPGENSSIRIGQILQETLGCKITNPQTLFEIGHAFLELNTEVHRIFAGWEIV